MEPLRPNPYVELNGMDEKTKQDFRGLERTLHRSLNSAMNGACSGLHQEKLDELGVGHFDPEHDSSVDRIAIVTKGCETHMRDFKNAAALKLDCARHALMETDDVRVQRMNPYSRSPTYRTTPERRHVEMPRLPGHATLECSLARTESFAHVYSADGELLGHRDDPGPVGTVGPIGIHGLPGPIDDLAPSGAIGPSPVDFDPTLGLGRIDGYDTHNGLWRRPPKPKHACKTRLRAKAKAQRKARRCNR